MRKLKRSVERNRKSKRVASTAMMTVLATSLAVSDSAVAVYAAEPSGYTSEYESETESEETTVDESIEEESTEEETTEEETTEEETTEEETTEEETTEEAPVHMLRGSRTMMLGATAPGNKAKTIVPSDNEIIDIGAVELSDEGKIEINITNDGTYTFTGSNHYASADAYIDVSITVAADVTADIYLDNLNICNDDYVCTVTTSTPGVPVSSYGNIVKPFVINGTANVYVTSNSQIAAISDFFEVKGDGTLNFIEAKGGLSFAPSTHMISSENANFSFNDPYIFNGTGSVHMTDADFTVSNEALDNSKTFGSLDLYYTNGDSNRDTKIYVESENVHIDGNTTIHRIYTDLIDLSNLRITPDEIYTLEGNQTYIGDMIFPEECIGGKIVQIDSFVTGSDSSEYDWYIQSITKPENLNIDSGRSVTGLRRSENTIFYIEKDGNVTAYESCYNYNSFTEPYTPYGRNVVEITFKDAESREKIYSYYSLTADYVFDSMYSHNHLYFPSEEKGYKYTYALEDGTKITKDSYVDKQAMTILVTKSEIGKISVTVDNVTKELNFGAALSTFGSINGYYQDADTGKLVTATTLLEEDRSYTFNRVALESETHDGKESFKLTRDADVFEFAKVVNNGATDINGHLTSNVTLDSSFPMIGATCDTCYTGTFDGCSNTVTLAVNSASDVAGLFGFISSGARIKNTTINGSVTGKDYVGGIAGAVYNNGGSIVITNCINNALIDYSGSRENYYYASNIGGLIGCQLSGYHSIYSNPQTTITFTNCGNTGSIYGEGGGGIIGTTDANDNFNYCYNADDSYICARSVRSNDTYSGCYSRKGNDAVTEKSADAFTSGEVAYLMNKDANTTIWYQTCGSGAPAFSGQTIYAGYANCDATDLSYANTEFTHTQPGHKDSGNYEYVNGTIVATCVYCTDEITADINCDSEELSSAMHGVTVTYSTKWVRDKYPDITIKYCDTKDGDYTEDIPETAGTWYIKVYVGASTDGIEIDDATYTIKPKKIVPASTNDNSNSDSDNSGNNDGVESSTNNQMNEADSLIRQISDFTKQQKVTSSTGNKSTSQQIKVFEYNQKSISTELISALRNCPNAVIHYSYTYNGQKYEFNITSEDAALFDSSIKCYGPSYIRHILNLRRLNIISPERQYTVKENDSLISILRRFGMSILEFFVKNPSIKGANDVKFGQKLNL